MYSGTVVLLPCNSPAIPHPCCCLKSGSPDYDTFLGAQPEVFIVISHPSLNREKGQAESAKPLALQFTAQMFAMAWIGSQLKPGYGDSVWVTQIDDKTSGTLAVTSCFPGCALVGSWLASGAGSGI